jgi:hypothetical protein
VDKQFVRLIISASAAGSVIAAGAMGPAACSSSPGTVATSNNNSTTTSSQSTSTAASGSESSTAAAGACPNDLIDDMTAAMGPTLTGGYWYTYSDRTCTSDLPALIRGDAGGTLTPEEGQQYLSQTNAPDGAIDGPVPPCTGMPMPYRDLQGGGETAWGAGFGFDFLDSPTSPSPFSACSTPEDCTGTPAPNAYQPTGSADGGPATNAYATPFDVSAHKGIAFYARVINPPTSSPFKLDVHLSDQTSTPGGGVCDACLYGGNGDGGANEIRCSDDWIETVTLTTSWALQTVKFTDATLKTGGWSSTPTKPLPASDLNLKQIYYLHFQISDSNDSSPLKPFDVQVAYVYFVD